MSVLMSDLMVTQDKVLNSISINEIDRVALRELPPWRAVLLARIAYQAKVLPRMELDRLADEARRVGGDGTLRTWEKEKKLLAKNRGALPDE